MKYHFFHVVGVRPDLKFAHLQYNCVDKSDISWKMKIEIKYMLQHTCMRKNNKLQRKIYLGIQWEIIEYHGTYECDLGCLRVHYLIPSIYPQSSQLGQDIYYLKKETAMIILIVSTEIWQYLDPKDTNTKNTNTPWFQSSVYIHVQYV